jgi:internalin A
VKKPFDSIKYQLSNVSPMVLENIEKARRDHAKELKLSGYYLIEVPESIGQLQQLQSLDFSNNKFTALPESIGQLQRLLSLNFSKNLLTTLPESAGQLLRLQRLDLGSNKLRLLPGFISQLQQLQSLYLGFNELTTLPESIGRLQRLQYLDLSNNRLTTLPESMWQLKALEGLFLHGNDSLGLPVDVLGPTWLDVRDRNAKPVKPSLVLDYYFRLKGGKRLLNEAKLILVGRGGVGKTSIVNRLVHNKYEKDEKKTEGIQITKWPIRLNGDEDVRLHIWDFGGQEIMHATHQFFLTQRSLYMLVINGREGGEDADADYWLKLIESFGGESPVIVMLNKIKEHPFDLNRRALQQKYPAIREFIKTDCADGTGIGDLRRAVERETDRLEHLRDLFPASWFTIKDRLAGMEKNYLTFDQYREVCAEENETDGSAQESLAFYLHHLGIVLNFKDDPRLQDTHVLNPHWVTRGIYKILNAERLERQKGEIGLRDLSAILNKTEYPRTMHRFIFDLMKKFELCFSFPDDDACYLVPELLDKQEPEETAEFNPAECLNFEYHYPVLPEGLLPRFIVRTSSLSEGPEESKLRWRTGVILRFEDCRALVKADLQDKRIFIHVKGPAASRRRLLAIIRSDFERIHRDIRKLEPQEMVPLPEHPNVVMPYQELLVMERSGMTTFPKVVGAGVTELNVQRLLNGVDLEGTRRSERELEWRSDAVQLFLSYSHKDESLRNELETHLKLLQRQRLIETWYDRLIEAGDEWKEKIDDNLERAEIILLLVSADFIASDYCYEKEMRRALERHEKGEARVIPVIVRDVNWSRAPFAKLQALPKDSLAVTKWPDKDSAWRNVSEGIEKVAEEMRKKSRR